MAGPKRTGAQILWESLVREGVTCVFGYPGGAILPAYDAMLDYPIRHILAPTAPGLGTTLLPEVRQRPDVTVVESK